MGFGVRPSELAPFCESHGFETLEVIASEGVGTGIEEVVSELYDTDPAAYDRLMDIILKCAADPSVHGLTTHLLYVGAVR